ncbi:hypothetical protein IQ269_11885 [Tychonema sp. LEGE 07199]|uniref:hypothetical protein n=1 Tax=unclassified Tychonema TaxID=2642144 RepID=UPI00187FBC86|nr:MULTISPECIES: hypothetical protein [unclassified Tychonema]MBE9121478.1 hypothetical protein [Tychonema sp. LEGE 07199]MBE9130355.1 hypothetical protein [Tychonema sp. LEGE 07196]
MAVGSWQLVVGSWQLAVGSWQLLVGRGGGWCVPALLVIIWQLAVVSWQLAVVIGNWELISQLKSAFSFLPFASFLDLLHKSLFNGYVNCRCKAN